MTNFIIILTKYCNEFVFLNKNKEKNALENGLIFHFLDAIWEKNRWKIPILQFKNVTIEKKNQKMSIFHFWGVKLSKKHSKSNFLAQKMKTIG